MTGFSDVGMVLSKLTIGTLADMGYSVDYSQAEPFDLSGPCCSSQRFLRGASDRIGSSRRRLTPENEAMAMSYGKAELQKMRELQNELARLPSTTLGIIGSITVYVQQDGHVIDVDVFSDENDLGEENIFDHSDELNS